MSNEQLGRDGPQSEAAHIASEVGQMSNNLADGVTSEKTNDELVEVVRQTVGDLERLMDRLRRYVEED